jgi:hypothetical protein
MVREEGEKREAKRHLVQKNLVTGIHTGGWAVDVISIAELHSKSLPPPKQVNIGKHATNRKIQFTRSNHCIIHPQYTKYPYSQKSTSINIQTYSDHIKVLHNFSTLHINISRSTYIYI